MKKLTKGRQGGPFAILQRPELAPYVIGVISAWAHTEVTLGRILAHMLHAESSVAIKMYLSLTGSVQRREALRAAAEHVLNDEHKALFTVMMKAIKSVRERRNDFAHGLWGVAEELPDALLWDSADVAIEDRELAIKHQRSFGDAETIVYRKADLQACLQDAQDAVTLVRGIEVLIFPGWDYAHDETRQLLSALPLLVRHGGLPTP